MVTCPTELNTTNTNNLSSTNDPIVHFSVVPEESEMQYSSKPTPFLPLPKSYLVDYLKRPVLIKTYFSDSDGPTSTGIFNAFYTASAVDVLKSFKNIRACLMIRVVSLGNPTYYGTSLIAFRPHTFYTDFSRNLNSGGAAAQLTSDHVNNATKFYQLPHVQINYEEYQAQTICLPFSCNNYCIDKTGEMWYMRHWRVNVCKSNSNTTPEPLEFNVYCHLEDVELFNILNESGKKESVPISGHLAYVASMLKQASTLFPFVTPWQKLATVSSEVALSMGFSRPISVPLKSVVTRSNTTLAYSSGQPDFSTKFSIDPSVSRSVVPFHPLSKENDLDLYSHLKSYDFLGTNLSLIYVEPTWQPNVTDFIPTRLAYFSAMFSYWSGSIKYRIEFVGNSLLRQNYAILVLPPGVSALASYSGTSKIQTYIVEVCGRTVFEVEVPYFYTRPLFDVSNFFSGIFTGTRLQILPITNCTGQTGTPTNIPYNVFVCAGETFQVSVPTLANHNNWIIEESQVIEITGERISNLKQLLGMPCISSQIHYDVLRDNVLTIPVLPVTSSYAYVGLQNFCTYLERISVPFVCATGSVRHKLLGETSLSHTTSFLTKSQTQTQLSTSTSPFGKSCNFGSNEFEILLTTTRQFFDPYTHFASSLSYTFQPCQSIALAGNNEVSTKTYTFNDFVSGGEDYMLSGFLSLPALKPRTDENRLFKTTFELV